MEITPTIAVAAIGALGVLLGAGLSSLTTLLASRSATRGERMRLAASREEAERGRDHDVRIDRERAWRNDRVAAHRLFLTTAREIERDLIEIARKVHFAEHDRRRVSVPLISPDRWSSLSEAAAEVSLICSSGSALAALDVSEELWGLQATVFERLTSTLANSKLRPEYRDLADRVSLIEYTVRAREDLGVEEQAEDDPAL